MTTLLAVLLVLLFALLWSPYFLAGLVIIAGVYLWEKDSRFGIGFFLLAVAVFGILYQTGVLVFLSAVRPESIADTNGFKMLYPSENYTHCSYYLLDWITVFLRICFPVLAVKEGGGMILYAIFQTLFSLAALCVIVLDILHGKKDIFASIRKYTAAALFGLLFGLSLFATGYEHGFRGFLWFLPLFAVLFASAWHTYGKKDKGEAATKKLPE